LQGLDGKAESPGFSEVLPQRCFAWRHRITRVLPVWEPGKRQYDKWEATFGNSQLDTAGSGRLWLWARREEPAGGKNRQWFILTADGFY